MVHKKDSTEMGDRRASDAKATLLKRLSDMYPELKGVDWEKFFDVKSGTISTWRNKENPKDAELIQVIHLLLQVDESRRAEVAAALKNRQMTKESLIAIKNAAAALSNPILSSTAGMLGGAAFGALGIAVGVALATWLGEKKSDRE